jgi:4-amino-4-deoxy-L-arabinose transferase-like glycosyltransferase
MSGPARPGRLGGLLRPGRIGRPKRPIALAAAVVALAAIVLVVVVCSQTGWRDRYVQFAPAQEPVATLESGAAQACADVGPLPDGAARTAFTVEPPGPGATVRAVASGAGVATVNGPPTAVGGPMVRPALGAVPDDGRPRRICLQHVSGPAVTVLGLSGVPALRLTGAEQESVWSVAGAIVDRSMRANGAPARWVGLPGALVLLVLASGAALVLVVRVWRPGWVATRRTWAVVVGVALLHGAAWSIVTPPFEVPDEWSHYHYADYVADHGTLPNGSLAEGVRVAPDQDAAMSLVGANGIPQQPTLRPPWSATEDARIRAILAKSPDSPVPDGRTSSTGQPPGYYLAAAAVEKVAAGNVLDRIGQVRLVGVLALALLAAGAMALARRLAPRRPEWAVTVGLLAGLVPLLGFLAGGVTPDVVLVALAVWTTWAAVAFVDGPDWRSGLRLGLLVVALVLVKLTALALVPGIAVLVVLALATRVRRGWPAGSTGAVVGLLAGLAIPLAAYVVWCVASDRSIVPGVLAAVARSEVDATVAPGTKPVSFLSLAWQLYLPALPGMNDLIPGVGLRTIWLNGFVGRYGWLDYGLPRWVNDVLPLVWIGVFALGVGGLRRLLPARGSGGREIRVRRITIGAAFLLLLLGLLFAVARADYSGAVSGGDRFMQPRYLLPALPVAVLLVLLAFRGTPARARQWLAVGLVGVSVLHVVASILATVGRYYV